MTEAALEATQSTWMNISDAEFLQKIGEVVTHWSFLEALIEDAIAGFLGADVGYVYAITADMNSNARIIALTALSRQRLGGDDFKELEQFLKYASTLAGLRNRIAHGLWTETNDPEQACVAAVRSRGKVKYQMEFMSKLYLDWLDVEIHKTSTELMQFLKGFGLMKDETSPSSA